MAREPGAGRAHKASNEQDLHRRHCHDGFGRHIERGIADLAREALRGALQDAGCAVSDIDTALYAGITNGALQGQVSIPGQAVFGKIGIRGIPVFNIENACASGLAAPALVGPGA